MTHSPSYLHPPYPTTTTTTTPLTEATQWWTGNKEWLNERYVVNLHSKSSSQPSTQSSTAQPSNAPSTGGASASGVPANVAALNTSGSLRTSTLLNSHPIPISSSPSHTPGPGSYTDGVQGMMMAHMTPHSPAQRPSAQYQAGAGGPVAALNSANLQALLNGGSMGNVGLGSPGGSPGSSLTAPFHAGALLAAGREGSGGGMPLAGASSGGGASESHAAGSSLGSASGMATLGPGGLQGVLGQHKRSTSASSQQSSQGFALPGNAA